MNMRIRLNEHSLMLIMLNGQNVLRIKLNDDDASHANGHDICPKQNRTYYNTKITPPPPCRPATNSHTIYRYMSMDLFSC